MDAIELLNDDENMTASFEFGYSDAFDGTYGACLGVSPNHAEYDAGWAKGLSDKAELDSLK